MMKIHSLAFVALLCLCAAFVRAPDSQTLHISAQMGARFGTLDVSVEGPQDWGALRFYYLAQERGAPAPDKEAVLAYAQGLSTEGLAEGRVVRGHWRHTPETARISLAGGENVKSLQEPLGAEGMSENSGERGFVDGYRYDLYVLAVGPDGRRSNLAAAFDVMAMPFDALCDDGVFVLREAHQLANIQRLADLHRDSQGLHGGLAFLEARYLLAADLDLSGYENWTPIGEPAFCGHFDGGKHSLRGLRIASDAEKPLGLFGTVQGGTLENVRLEDAQVSGPYSQAVGGVAGSVTDETGPVTLRNLKFDGRVTGGRYTGGLFGAVQGSMGEGGPTIAISDGFSAGTVTLRTTPQTPGNTQGALGGFAGVLEGCVVSDCASVGSPVVSDYARHIGGFVGLATACVFERSSATRDVSGVDQAGGFAGSLDQSGLVRLCRASGDVQGAGEVGGFVGAVRGQALSENAHHTVQILQSRASGQVQSAEGLAGGFAGHVAYAYLSECSASGDVWATGPEAGGFVGRLSHSSRITNACAYGHVTQRKQGPSGGFVGLVTQGSGIEYAFSAGDVQGRGDTGGFAGAVALAGAPNTLWGCVSFARRVHVNDPGEFVHRFIGRPDHPGAQDCYAYLGCAVSDEGRLRHVMPNPFGPDGGDLNAHTLQGILARLGWSPRIWAYTESTPGTPLRLPFLRTA